MKVDVDLKERIKIIILFMLQSYKVVMGTMLSLFVSQKCIENNVEKVCSLKENVLTDDVYHQIVLIMNGLTLMLFIFVYYIELKRENYCVKHFDIDHTVPDDNIIEILDGKPELKAQLAKINNRYYKFVKLILFVYFLNFLASGGIIFDEHRRNGSTTYTGFFSFTLLVMSKLYDSFIVSYSSSKGKIIQSAYLKEYSSFNILDRTEYGNNRP